MGGQGESIGTVTYEVKKKEKICFVFLHRRRTVFYFYFLCNYEATFL